MSERAIARFVDALLPEEHGGPDARVVARRVDAYLHYLPPPARVATRAAFATYAAYARAGGSLVRAGDSRVFGLGVDALKALVLLVAGAHDAASAYTGEVARPDAPLNVTASAAWPSVSACDAVVIGSGAGGAMAARTLARAGLDTVVIEEGRRFAVDEFRSGHPLDRFGQLYRDGGSTAALGRPPVVLPIGRGVGGSTLVNSGTCYRPPHDILVAWSKDAGFALADPDRFGPHLDDVEATLQVAPVPASVMGRNGELLLAGARALGWRGDPLLRNAPGCGGCCQCAIGCPRNAKLGVHLNALPQACAAGARIVTDARVVAVVHERGRAVGVRAKRPDGSRFEVRAPRVVVAAGATETPPLLKRSGLGRHRSVGRYLSIHPAVSAAGRFGHDVIAWNGVLQSAAVEQFHVSDGILIEATSTPPGMGSMILPGYGRALLEELQQAHRLVTLGAMIADEPRGRVFGGRRTVLIYDVSRRDGDRLRRALRIMGELLFAAGAYEVLAIPNQPGARNLDQLDASLARLNPRSLHLAAFHPTGSAGAGADPQRFAVDPSGRLRGVDGVWVADASILPSCPGVNPQVSVMAAALAVAGEIVATTA